MQSQSSKLLDMLSDFQPHSTVEIMEKVYGNDHLGLSRVGARIFDIRKKGHDIEGWKDPNNPTIYWYKLNPSVQKAVSAHRPGIHPPAQGGLFQQTQWTNY